jgi:transcription antitermination factor NusG
MVDQAIANCKRQGWEPYYPTFFNDRTRKRQGLFAPYMFVDCRGEWGPLANTVGISSVVTFNEGHAAEVEDHEIRKIKRAENKNGNVELADIEFEVGDAIEVMAGRLEGLEGTYGGHDDTGRIKFLYSMLGRASHTYVRRSQVQKRA